MTDLSLHRERHTTKTNADIRQTLCPKILYVWEFQYEIRLRSIGDGRTSIANYYGCTRVQANAEVSIGFVLAYFVACGALAVADP